MFAIDKPTFVKMQKFTPRVEKHGKEEVSAVTLRLALACEAEFLETVSPGARDTLFKAIEGQEQLPGVPVSTPLRRCRAVTQMDLALKHEGYTLTIDRGIDAGDPIVITKCKVDCVSVRPQDHEAAWLLFNVGSSDVSEDEGGWLFGHQRQTISITLKPPVVTEGEPIDGTKGHPGADGQGSLIDPEEEGEDGEGDTPEGALAATQG